MADIIKQLPDFVANQIAAGEVVNRPASVVKELVENAVDAGSTNITVNFRNGGKDLIQIVDNGCGMSPTDARLAFSKHATSKIDNVDDIYKLSTLGFRGEALASVASIAEVELKSRTKDSDVGVQVLINGGNFVGQSVVSCPVGSQFFVRNLFYNIPARKRFLDKNTKETNHIQAEFNKVALCHPEVGFSLYDSDSLIMELPIASLKQRIIGVIGKGLGPKLLEVETRTTLGRLKGFVGRPSAAKKNNREQYLFVNGRYFKSPYFHKAILNAYEKLIPVTDQPSYFLYLNIEPDRIDVNVHPQKTEVKFEDSAALWQIVNAAVREAIAKSGQAPQMDFDMDTSIEIPAMNRNTQRLGYLREPVIRANPEFNPFNSHDSFDVIPKSITTDVGYIHSNDSFEDELPSYESSLLEFIEGDEYTQSKVEFKESVAPVVKEILSIGKRFVAMTIDDNLTIVDICRAYETVLYYRYIKIVGGGSSVTQKLLFPESMTMSTDDYQLLKEFISDFTTIGIDLELKEDNTVEILGVPAEFSNISIVELIYDLLDGMRDETTSVEEARKDHLAKVVAQVGSSGYRRGVVNSVTISDLITELRECPNPSHSPSGLPVMTTLSQQDIMNIIK